MKAGDYNRKRHTWDSISDYVREFQREHNLKVDGMAGPLTDAALSGVQARRSTIDKSHPLPMLADGRKPHATNLFRPGHWGWDYFYRYEDGDEIASDDHVVFAGGRRRWWYPEGWKAVAAAHGVCLRAEEMGTGHWVWLLHDDGYATGYFHGTDVLVGVGEVVHRGAPVITIGWDTRDKTWDKHHLHFEVRKPNDSEWPGDWSHVDPKTWFSSGAGYVTA